MDTKWTEFDALAASSLFFLGHRPGLEEEPIAYPANPADRPHLAYYGTTRSGKTYAIEYALQQIAKERSAGFCYIDPHGSSYWRMASFLRQHGIIERVIHWDINDPEYVVTYDPFGHPGQPPSYIAGNLTAALLSTLGRSSDPSEQPHLKTITEDGLSALLELGLSFPLAHDLFDPSDTELKELVARALTHSNMVSTIARMKSFRERYQELAAPFRRFKNLFADDRLRLSFSSAGLNFPALMDEGWIVLVNAEPRQQYDEAAALFVRLLVKQFFMAAKTRDPSGEPCPFFLAIDEASRYLTTDTARILAETAKYGLYLLLGMQSAEQARRESEETYIAIRANVNGEVVMRLSDYDERLYFSRRFFADSFDPKAIKHEQVRTVAIPETVAHATLTRSVPKGPALTYVRSNDPSIAVSESETRSPEVVIEGEAFHTEYTYGEERVPTFYTPAELEAEAAKLFSVRPVGKASRFGVARVNERRPEPIEIPELDPPLYSRAEMEEYLRRFKAGQPATLPFDEAAERSHRLITRERQLLTERVHGVSEASIAAEQKPSKPKKFTF